MLPASPAISSESSGVKPTHELIQVGIPLDGLAATATELVRLTIRSVGPPRTPIRHQASSFPACRKQMNFPLRAHVG